MVIFHSYVKLPEGISKLTAQSSSRWAIHNIQSHVLRKMPSNTTGQNWSRANLLLRFNCCSADSYRTQTWPTWHVFNTETCSNQQVWPQKVFFHKGKCTSINIYLIYPSIDLSKKYIHWLKALCDTPTPSKQHISPHVLFFLKISPVM